jgi:hypothetical protein
MLWFWGSTKKKERKEFYSFIHLAVIFRSITHFELIFVHGIKKGFNFILLYVDTQSWSVFIFEEMIFSASDYLDTLFESQLPVGMDWIIFPWNYMLKPLPSVWWWLGMEHIGGR